jgi:hypothetical protein
MSFHITPLFFTQAMRACTAIFAACYLLLLVTTFRPTRSWRLRFCGALWTGLFLQYVLSFVGTRLDVRKSYWFLVTVILVDLIQLTSLVLIAETLPVADSASSRQTFVRTRRIGISAALLLALATAGAAFYSPSARLTDLMTSIFGFAAVSWFVLRWSMAVPRRLLYLAFPILLYALSYLFLFGGEPASDSPMRVVISILNLGLYVCLAFACYYVLSDPERRSVPVVSHRVSSAPNLPEGIKLDNLWALLYLAFHEPFGKAAVLAFAGSCLALALAIASATGVLKVLGLG